jgi:hypothetical protein
MPSLENSWKARFQAVARAQNRYLYILLIACVFFWALRGRVRLAADTTQITLPIVDVEVEGLVVLAIAPIVIAFLLLAVLGTFPALRVAYKQMGGSSRDFESYDTEPTAIDFVVYSTSRNAVRRLGLLSYPLVLTLALVEAVWLWVESLNDRILAGRVAQGMGIVLLLVCIPRMYNLWESKVKHLITGEEPA